MQSHIKVVHEKLKRFNCGMCSFKGSKVELLTKHIDKHHVPSECSKCQFKCVNAIELKSHTKKHAKTEFICRIYLRRLKTTNIVVLKDSLNISLLFLISVIYGSCQKS